MLPGTKSKPHFEVRRKIGNSLVNLGVGFGGANRLYPDAESAEEARTTLAQSDPGVEFVVCPFSLKERTEA